MYEFQTKIGDHYIQIVCESETMNKFFRKNFLYHIETENMQPILVINLKDGYGISFLDYEVEITNHGDKIIYRRADYQIEVDVEYQSATISVFDELALKHALTNLYSSFIVHHNWGLLLHSSCAIENGKAHIFAGQSGAGKSTAAKLSYPRSLLSDEATLLKITNDEVTVFNSPFRSELEADPFGGTFELASIQLLHQAIQNKRAKVGMSDALLQLMDKVFFWPKDQEETRTILKLMTMLVKQVPVYDLYFQKNNTFWELIS